MKQSIAKNYIFNLVFQLLTVITPLITTPYIARVLGPENNGIYGYTFSIITYFVLFGSLGVAMYGQREIAYVQENKDKQEHIFWELVLIRLVTNGISLIIYYFVFCNHGNYSTYYKILIFELFANAIDISWYFMGIEEFGKPVVRNVIVKILGLISIFVFVKTRNDLWKYLLIYSLSDFLGNISLWLYVPKYISVKPLNSLRFQKHLRPIISLFIPQIATQVYTVLDKTMVGNMMGDMSEVGYYDNAQKIVKALLCIVTAMSSVMSSRIANTYSTGDKESMKIYLRQSIHLAWMVAVPFALGIVAISKVFVPWYFGEGYESVTVLMCATTPILLAIGLSNITGIQYLIQVGQQKIYTFSVVSGAICNLVCNYILINLLGTIGAVLSTVISEYLILFIQLLFVKNEFQVSEFFKPSSKYLLSGLMMFICVLFSLKLWSNSTIAILFSIIIGIVVYICGLFILKDTFFLKIIHQIFGVIHQKLKVKH